MKNKLILLLIVLSHNVVCASTKPVGKLVFDMANAVMKHTYMDVPVYFLANASVASVDFALTYNETVFTYDSIINVTPDLSGAGNLVNHVLRFSGQEDNGTSTTIPFKNNTTLLYIRFKFNSQNICQRITSADLNPNLVLLDTISNCTYQVTTPLPFTVPIANFSNNAACQGSSVKFLDSSKVAMDSITSWRWDFGNGTTSTSKNPSTTYATAASYSVTLIAKSDLGCSDTVTKSLQVGNYPIVDFTYSPDCPSGNLVFTDLSYIYSPDTIAVWSWDFGDHKPLVHLQNPVYDYDYGGSYKVTLTVTSESGCKSDTTHKVAVTVLSAIFGAKNGCKGIPITFLDSSITAASAGKITSWKWYFGDGTGGFSHGDTSHTFKDTGTYVVSLKVTSATCSDSIAHTIVIQDKPIVKFSEDKLSGCMPLIINFSDSSITSAGSVYSWNFGDNRTATSKNASHTYIDNGNLSVTHYVTTSAGCADSLAKSSLINVYGAMVAFMASPQKVKLPNASVSFTNLTKNYTAWMWSFGDSTFSTNKNTAHVFADTGSYTVCLMGKDAKGCSDTHCDTVTVIAPNIVAIPEAFTPNNDNINDVLKVRGGPITEMEWRIFDEWGKQVFYSNQQSTGWEGTYNGIAQPIGVYEYTLKGKTVFDNETINMHGVVNLVR
jgi:gliding motility-associated-like protein